MMTKVEKDNIIKMLDESVESYLSVCKLDDYHNTPCVRHTASERRSVAFYLAEYLSEYGFITAEQCCEYWDKLKIDRIDASPKCQHTWCIANINGVCTYTFVE